MPNTTAPSFPTWNDVTMSLFLNGFEKSSDINNESLKSFLELISEIPQNYELPPSGMEQIMLSQKSTLKRRLALRELSEEEVKLQLSKLSLAKNEFYLIGSTSTFEFVWVSENTKDLMGLKSSNDFTFMKICGMDDNDELYHPEDVDHIIRLGTCALIIVAESGVEVNPFTDYYEVSFRTGWSHESKHKTIRRSCYMSNLPNEVDGTRHFDTWCVTNGYDRFDHLHWLLHHSDSKIMTRLNGMFYILNCVLIGITPQEAMLANLLTLHGPKYKKIFNNEIAKVLGLDTFEYENNQTYFNQKSQLKKKIDKLIIQTTKGSKFKSNPSSSTLHFQCGQLGILGMDQNLMECIWKNVM